MIQRYDGAKIVDSEGRHVGPVDETYVDDDGAVRFIEVKLGTLFAKHKLIPIDGAEFTEDSLHVPFTKHVIEGSPDVPSDADMLEGEALEQVRRYYRGGEQSETRAASAPVSEPTGTSQMVDSAPTTVRESDVREDEDIPVSSGQRIGQARDLGDVIEVPIVEEVLVKQPVVKEVIRIRKRQTSEQRTVGAEVRKEDLEVDDPQNLRSSE